MSRGPGKIQRYILDEVSRSRDRELVPVLVPVVVLAGRYASREGIDSTEHLRASFRRAANQLIATDDVLGWEVLAPTRRFEDQRGASWRWVSCVGPAGMEVTDDAIQHAQMAMVIFHTG